VLKRSRQDEPHCEHDTGKCFSTIDRVIWDGDQILWELRLSEAGGNLDVKDPDGGPYSGHVGYIHGGDVDAPVGIIRQGAQSVHQNWRGLYMFSLDTDGDEPTASTNYPWPAARYSTHLRASHRDTTYWYGSLVSSQRDATGLSYRRNRYYDPVSGQFTQTDPIGIAGGLNTYGYAGGDPVNFSDPFGLSADPCEEIWDEEERAECEEQVAELEEAADERVRQCRVATLGFLATAGSDAISLTGVGAAAVYGIKGLRLARASDRAPRVTRSGQELYTRSANLLQQSDHAYQYSRAAVAGAYTTTSETIGAGVAVGVPLGLDQGLSLGGFAADVTPVLGSVRAYNTMQCACEGF